ncbi:MAG: TatD family hydrolase [Chloroflexi bacterium]|nr:TatD family hydrolase [Chloroflexota bacterium]
MLIDTHTHLDLYGENAASALREINAARIFSIAVSMDLDSYAATKALAAGQPLVVPTFGIHPENAHLYAERLDELVKPTLETPLIGEIGLDYYFVKEAERYPAQRTVFEFFLAAARDQGKIVNLHTKGAEADIVDDVRRYELPRVIVHWYSGPLKQFKRMRELGIYFTVGVELGHSDHIATIAREIPDDRLLTETDNPGGTKWLSGEWGVPGDVRTVYQRLAEVRGTTPDALEEQVTANFRRLIADDVTLVAQFDAARA